MKVNLVSLSSNKKSSQELNDSLFTVLTLEVIFFIGL